VEVGQKNVVRAKKFLMIWRQSVGKHITKELVASLSQQSTSFFAPKIACASAPGTRNGIDLKNVSVDTCYQALASTCLHCKEKSGEFVSLAIDLESGGKRIFVEMKNVLEGVISGAVVRGTRMTYRDVTRLDFDDHGLIIGLTIIGDDGIMRSIESRVKAYTSGKRQELLGRPYTGGLVACGVVVGLVAISMAVGLWVSRLGGRKVGQPALLG